MKKFIQVLIVVVFLSPTVTVVNAQCPMCKTALKSNVQSKNTKSVGNGINKGILFLLACPYIVVAAGGVYFYRRQKAKRMAAIQELLSQ